MSGKAMDVGLQDFKNEVLESKIPVLVDFWAEWCMPCKMIAPAIDELSEDLAGKVKFAKVNVDDNTQLATDLQILSIPALILFDKGKEVKRIIGANPKAEIQKEIEKALK